MEIPSTFSVSDSISFEDAIELTQSLLAEVEQRRVSEPELESIITALVQSENGARGFFVTYLTSDRDLADHPSTAVIQALQSSPQIVTELLVKNLAMSTAMILTHLHNQNPEMAKGSERVQQRTQQIVQMIQLPEISTRLQQFQASAQTGDGEYAGFLSRWKYDAEQRQSIAQQVKQSLDRLTQE
ncbi:MAG: hypothetical protein KME18_13290 [Phormidium tanganyikae FI6-MK23]|jgi:hypothetical protein|nr:hypothetical protein [Phormidium tanganyikae FI6-MK23]